MEAAGGERDGPRPHLRLKPGEERAVRAGFPWVFANEVQAPPAASLRAGDEVAVEDARGSFVGAGFVHPGAPLLVRIHERRPGRRVDADWWVERLAAAWERRAPIRGSRTAFRWVFAEADQCPGLLVDRYDGEGRARAVLACNSAGVERWKDTILQILLDRWALDDLVIRSDGRGRQLEGLQEEVRVVAGQGGPWQIDDDGAAVRFDPVEGQKTGLFLDMWENRRRVAPFLGGRVADLYAYVGQWSLAALRCGAAEVWAVDRSAGALAFAREAARVGAGAERLHTETTDVDTFLAAQDDRSFDTIICDPPAFVPHRRALEEGERAYVALFARSLQKLRRGGRLVAASCSSHLSEDRFDHLLGEAARRAGRRLGIVLRGAQSPCHPVPLAFPQGRYLKTVLAEVD